jgi:predicted GTPase
VVYAGVDYQEILRMAENEADVIIWDGGNNDFPFYKPDLLIVVVDPHRPGHEMSYHPGETNVRMADVIVINKMDTARPENVKRVEDNVKLLNPNATIIRCRSRITVENPESIRGKSVLVVEDGPSITHGELPYGAAYYAARLNGAREIIDPAPFAVGAIRDAMQQYSHLSVAVPTVGYGAGQISDLQETINRVPAEIVVSATPVRLSAIAKLNKPVVQVRYELEEIGRPTIEDIVRERLKI